MRNHEIFKEFWEESFAQEGRDPVWVLQCDAGDDVDDVDDVVDDNDDEVVDEDDDDDNNDEDEDDEYCNVTQITDDRRYTDFQRNETYQKAWYDVCIKSEHPTSFICPNNDFFTPKNNYAVKNTKDIR